MDDEQQPPRVFRRVPLPLDEEGRRAQLAEIQEMAAQRIARINAQMLIDNRELQARNASAKSSGTNISMGKNYDDDEVTSGYRKDTGGGAKHLYKKRSYKVHTGSKGGKYIVSKGKKIYV